MKVLHTIASLSPETGGPARSVPGLAAALAELGSAITLGSADRLPEGLSLNGIRLCQGTAAEFAIQVEGVDLVHDHGVWLRCNHSVARWTAVSEIPRIVSPRGMLEPWALEHRKWKKKLAWQLYQRRDLRSAMALHATSQAEAEQFRRLGLRQPIIILPNGVDLPPITDKGSPPTGLRTALFLSRIHPKKGLPMLLEAWSKLRPEGWRLKIVGPDEGGHRAELARLAALLGISEFVEFGEALEGPEKERAFAEAALFILPTHSENFGIVVAEAMAHGLPVITTHGAPWKLLERENCGWWVPVSIEGLAAALEDAITRTPEELAAMGSKGRAMMAKHFGWNQIAREMSACYAWLLGRDGKPDCMW